MFFLKWYSKNVINYNPLVGNRWISFYTVWYLIVNIVSLKNPSKFTKASVVSSLLISLINSLTKLPLIFILSYLLPHSSLITQLLSQDRSSGHVVNFLIEFIEQYWLNLTKTKATFLVPVPLPSYFDGVLFIISVDFLNKGKYLLTLRIQYLKDVKWFFAKIISPDSSWRWFEWLLCKKAASYFYILNLEFSKTLW